MAEPLTLGGACVLFLGIGYALGVLAEAGRKRAFGLSYARRQVEWAAFHAAHLVLAGERSAWTAMAKTLEAFEKRTHFHG